MTNRKAFADLVERDAIAVSAGVRFDSAPAALAGIDFDRVEGMMLGLAIGDALGNTSEGFAPHERRAVHGEIRDYLPNPYAGGRSVGLPSDDSQMAFWTLEQMLADGRYIPENLARCFATEQIFGIGQSVRAFRERYADGMAWHEAGVQSAGNGALMRIAAALVPHVREPSAELWVDVALNTATTHNDTAAIASSLTFVSVLWSALEMKHAPDPEWWLDSFVGGLREFEQEQAYSPRFGRYVDYRGPLSGYVERVVADAWRERLTVEEAQDRWGSAAYLLETVPTVVYLLMCHAGDPEEALVRAVNDTWDNDTVGAIVGAAVGALHGRQALPSRWVEGLLGRTRESDDGRVFELLAAARARFAPLR